MRVSIDNADFQVQSLIMLKDCALKGPDYQTLIKEHKGIELICHILEKFNTMTSIYRHGLAAIASVCCNSLTLTAGGQENRLIRFFLR
eukprot:m.271558 g.271558  ORF g.271558 m.271558 type:complete len:88 (+) comp40551_c0_seq10:1004-1267(+)